MSKTIDKDFGRRKKLSVPITFLILLIAFGAFVAAGVPVLLAFSAVLGSVGLSAIASHVFHASDATQSVILLMGMAVGVDYSLFYLKREREERAAGHQGHDALFRAAATSGQAVLISGFTVLVAMAGMLFAGTKIFTSIGIGAMLVVFSSLVGSLTVLPALLGKLDRYIERGLRQVLAATVLRVLRPFKTQPSWLVWLRETPTVLAAPQRQPAGVEAVGLRDHEVDAPPSVAVGVSMAAAGRACAAGAELHTKQSSFTDLPKSLSIVKTYDTIQASFPGSQDPAHLVVRANDVTTPQFAKAYAEFKKRALATGVIQQPIRVTVNRAKTVARVDFPLAGEGQDATAVRALATLRTEVIPPVLATLPVETEQAVTGATAANVDFNKTMKARAPIVFAFVLGFAFLLLLVTFRSIVIPIKAIILNLLSVGAAYGVLVWIFQYGHFRTARLPLQRGCRHLATAVPVHSPLRALDGLPRLHPQPRQGARRPGRPDRPGRRTRDPLHCIHRHERRSRDDRRLRDLRDIERARHQTARRRPRSRGVYRRDPDPGVLLPATMKLLGEWNWYLPRWLEWMPELNAEPKLDEDVPSAPPVPVA